MKAAIAWLRIKWRERFLAIGQLSLSFMDRICSIPAVAGMLQRQLVMTLARTYLSHSTAAALCSGCYLATTAVLLQFDRETGPKSSISVRKSLGISSPIM